jgi:hypothetical protein
MTTHTITRAAALVAGCIFVACAGAILFEDVALAGAPVTLGHVLTAGVLSGTLLVGHLLIEAGRGRHWLAALGFVILFVTGTVLIVYLSTGKQAEHTFQSQAEADFAADERARIRPLLKKAEGMHSETMEKIQSDCVIGRKSKGHCDGLRTTLAVYEAAVKGHKADLERLGAPKPVAPDAESFANVAVVLFGGDKATWKAGAILVVPFIRTILFELGGLWCLGFAFRPFPRSETEPATEATRDAQPSWEPKGTEQTSFAHPMLLATQQPGVPADVARAMAERRNRGNPGDGGNPGNGRPGGGPKPGPGGNRQAFEADVLTRLALGQTIESQDELARAHGVHKGVASKWLRDMRERGLIPAAQRVGRCHRLVAAE